MLRLFLLLCAVWGWKWSRAVQAKLVPRGLRTAGIVNHCAQTVLALIPKNACHFTNFPIAHQ